MSSAEESLYRKYANGTVKQGSEFYIPIELVKAFIADCTQLSLAVTGSDLFCLAQDTTIVVAPISSIESSSIFSNINSWGENVKRCNRFILETVCREEIKGMVAFFSFVVISEGEYQALLE